MKEDQGVIRSKEKVWDPSTQKWVVIKQKHKVTPGQVGAVTAGIHGQQIPPPQTEKPKPRRIRTLFG